MGRGPDPPGKSQGAIGFLRNTGMYPLEKQLDSSGVRPIVKYADGRRKKCSGHPVNSVLNFRIFMVQQVLYCLKQ